MYYKESGFSIVELVVTIAIISVLIAVVFSNLPQVELRLALSRTAYNFAEDLRKAQQMSLFGVPYKNLSGVLQEIEGYGIYLDLDALGNKKYIIYADKSPGNKEYDSSDYVVETVGFGLSDPGVKIKEINNVSLNKTSVNFNSSKIETTITHLNQNQNRVDFVFTLESDLAKTKSVLVNTSGLIEVK